MNKNWDFDLGHCDSCYAGYSARADVREKAASGGIVSGVLIHLLQSGKISGALVSRAFLSDGELRHETIIATTEDEVLGCASSIYFYFPVLDALKKVREFSGKIAVAGLPCHISALADIVSRDASLAGKIDCVISLFCGGNCQKKLLESVLRKNRIPLEKAAKLVFKRRHLGGELRVHLQDGQLQSLPFNRFNAYRILGFYRHQACKYCDDLTGECSDVSVGDIFIAPYKNKPIKHSSIICRNDKARQIIQDMEESGQVHVEPVGPEVIFESQKKILTYKKSMSARAFAGRLLGYRIDVRRPAKVRWNDFLAAFIVLMNEKLSEAPRADRIIFLIPRWAIYAFAFIQRTLTRF
jgi:coenzyme F420 hydrogenase subunit beta